MKKILSFVVIASLLVTLFAGCGGKGNSDVIKVGLLAPTSGPVAQYGQAVVNAATLAINKANEDGGVNGKKIEFIVYDNEADATKSGTLFDKLVDSDKIDAMLGPVISTTSLAVAPMAAEKGIPMLTPTATNKDVTPGMDNVFRACYIDPYQGAVVAKYAFDELGAKTAAVFTNVGNDYSKGLSEAFVAEFEAAGGTVTVAEGYTDSDKDFNSILAKVKTENPDVLFIPDYYNAVGVICSQAKELSIESQLLGGDGWDGIQAEFIEAAEGGIFGNHYSTKDTDPVVQDFLKAYKAEYNEDPNALAALGYDAANVLIEALRSAKSTDSKDIIEAINNTNYSGVTGKITFDQNGDPIKEISMIKVENGELMFNGKFSK